MIEKTAERLFHKDLANNFVFQRSLLAYVEAAKIVHGDILELGTGQGYGIEHIAPRASRFVTLDKFKPDEDTISHENVEFRQMTFPPLAGIDSDRFDFVISFQVIEHIVNDKLYVDEIHRVLKPGGRFILTTPNKLMSLTRNPWHIREYTVDELRKLLLRNFDSVDAQGVFGNDKITDYYLKNKESVRKITRFDFLNLQYRLPRQLLQVPYDLLNKLNRSKLLKENQSLVSDIEMDDYHIARADDACYDLFYIAQKKK
jgi:SAM-dependent methyltransferase